MHCLCPHNVHITSLRGFIAVVFLFCRWAAEAWRGRVHMSRPPGGVVGGVVGRGLSQGLPSPSMVLWLLHFLCVSPECFQPLILKQQFGSVPSVDALHICLPISKLICHFYAQSLERFSVHEENHSQSTEMWIVLSSARTVKFLFAKALGGFKLALWVIRRGTWISVP